MPLIKSGSKEALAYCAGLVDGEGSISAAPSHHSALNYRVSLAITMCDINGLKFVSNIFGGNIRKEKALTKSGKEIYSWAIYCRNAADALEQMLPYLQVKKSRAIKAIKLARMMRDKKSQRLPIGSDEIVMRHEIAASIRSENIASNGRLIKHASN